MAKAKVNVSSEFLRFRANPLISKRLGTHPAKNV
jgi:hypothetical protein